VLNQHLFKPYFVQIGLKHYTRRRPDGKSLISYISAGYEVTKCESKICPLWPFRNGIEENESIPHKKKSSYSTTHVKAESKNRQKGERVSKDGENFLKV